MDALFILFYLISFGFPRYCCNDPCDFFLCCHPEFLVGFESSLQLLSQQNQQTGLLLMMT